MEGVRKALESERKAEQEFVARAMQRETAPRGWPAALVMFHMSMWRERLRNALRDVQQGRSYAPPPDDVDAFNEDELASGIGAPLADAAARSDTLLAELIELFDELGDRPFKWYSSSTVGEAILRNSYTHPRLHICAYFRENDEPDDANRVFEEAVAEMREIGAPPIILGMVLYNLACTRAIQGRPDDSLDLLEEALGVRPVLKEIAAEDADFASLHDNERFQELVKS
ncbi:MAG TPA: hypothetical protein VET26_02830 [Candidatus Sulfotelmatobacter sp.]|nr:hypothetical protein [Candidatus Sulfotelmatobacter sp.]